MRSRHREEVHHLQRSRREKTGYPPTFRVGFEVSSHPHCLLAEAINRHDLQPPIGRATHLGWLSAPTLNNTFLPPTHQNPRNPLHHHVPTLLKPPNRLPNRTHTTHETFDIYRNFLYTSKLCTLDAHGDQDYADNGDAEAHEDREWMRLALAYFLGLKLGDEGFCNAVIGEWLRR